MGVSLKIISKNEKTKVSDKRNNLKENGSQQL
jgi:hypothetical protein